MARVVAALPAAAVGAVVHVVPYQIMKKLGALPRNESIKATVKLLGCAVLFAVAYVALGVVMGEAWGPWAGLGAGIAVPVCGYAAVRLAERVKTDRGRGGRVAGSAAATSRAGDGAEPPGRRGGRRRCGAGRGLGSLTSLLG